MTSTIVKELAVNVNLEEEMKKINVRPDSMESLEYYNTVELLKKRIQPKAIIKKCKIDVISRHTLIIDGVKFQSKILHYLLKDHKEVFLYLLTIGKMPNDLQRIERYFMYALRMPMMFGAMKQLKQELMHENNYKKIGIANPGLLADFSIDDSKTIFDCFGEATEQIGLKMKRNTLHPVYSSSGMLFDDFNNCCDCGECSIDGCIAREAEMTVELAAI